MIEFFQKLFSTDFMPHGYCIGRPEVIWLHEISDIVIALAYFVIPLGLLYIVRTRRDLVYPWLFLLFGVFILSCGATHVMAVYVLWHPVYRLDGIIKAITALASFPTAILLIRLVPKVKLLPSAQQLREHNAVLQSEVADRKRAEDEVRRLNEELERRVADRTLQLRQSNEELTRANADLTRTMAERTQAQDALNANRRFLDGISGVAPVLLYVYDLDQRRNLWMNDALSSILGYSTEEIRSMGDAVLPGLMHEQDAATYVSHYTTLRHLPLTETAELEYRMRHKDGTWRWVNSRERVFQTSVAGDVTQIAGAAQDITDRKRFEEALRTSEERFRELADNISQFAWMADETGSVFWFNQRWYDFTGTTFEQMKGSGRETVHHPDHMARVAENFRVSVLAGKPWEDTFPLRGKDGEYRWFLSRALPIQDENGRVVRWFGTNTDITEQRQVETELRRANSDLEQFAYSASHDLKEPLRNVTVYAQMLSTRYAPQLDRLAIQFLSVIQEGASRMEHLIADLLAFTQIRTADDSPAEVIDAEEVFQTVCQTFAGPIQEFGATVSSAGLPRITMHRAHFEQLLQNLIGNALKYRSEQAPTVEVSAELGGGKWQFSVMDNGMGIDQQYKETIFGIFRRLHTREEYSGTGMGLAICQRIVERYGGRIWVESEPGQGAAFRFTVPA